MRARNPGPLPAQPGLPGAIIFGPRWGPAAAVANFLGSLFRQPKHRQVSGERKGRRKNMTDRHPALAYVAPFAAFLCFLALKSYIPHEYPLRVIVVSAILIVFSRKVISLRVSHPISSVLFGVLLFVVWIEPDLLWPAYRQHWLFHNFILGTAQSTMPESARVDLVFLIFRVAGTALLVPIVEELFWRAWLMRYLVSPDFEKVRLGTYAALSFWLTAILFATEHGSYWEVGLIAGVAFNYWMIRTRSLGDCILVHGITNACLAAYVIAKGQWQYWL
jgi:CAAX prenyl protease-like protein